jgi:hypothetical protein
MSDEDIAAAIASIDQDGDGEISFGEFKVWWERLNGRGSGGGASGDSSAEDEEDDDDGESFVSPIQQRLLALIMLKNRKAALPALPTSSAARAAAAKEGPEELPDLSDPAVRRAGMMVVRAYGRLKVRRQAERYRREQLQLQKATPDWLSRQFGWVDAEEMLAAQYESDLVDSKHGMGCGLEWGAARGPLSPRPGVLFAPVGQSLRFESRRHLAAHMVGHALGTLAVSRGYGALHASVAVARMRKLARHRHEAREAAERRALTHARERAVSEHCLHSGSTRACTRARARLHAYSWRRLCERRPSLWRRSFARSLSLTALRSIVRARARACVQAMLRQKERDEQEARERAAAMAARMARMCRGWRRALPRVLICARLYVDCQRRKRAKDHERDAAEAPSEHIARVVEVLRSKQSAAAKATLIGRMNLLIEDWETPSVLRSMEGLPAAATSQGEQGQALLDLLGGVPEAAAAPEPRGGSAAAAAVATAASDSGLRAGEGSELQDSGVATLEQQEQRQQQEEEEEEEKEEEEEEEEEEGGELWPSAPPVAVDPGGGSEGQVAEAALILLVVSAHAGTGGGAGNDSLRASAAVTLRHRHCRRVAHELLLLFNRVSCGETIWQAGVGFLAYLVEGFFTIGQPLQRIGGALSGGESRVDQLYMPRDQQVLLDLLLRQQACVPFSHMRAWRLWLRAVAGVITCSADYQQTRHRRHELLDVLDGLVGAGVGGVEQQALCSGCRHVLYNALDEKEERRLLRAEEAKEAAAAAQARAEELAAVEAAARAAEAAREEAAAGAQVQAQAAARAKEAEALAAHIRQEREAKAQADREEVAAVIVAAAAVEVEHVAMIDPSSLPMPDFEAEGGTGAAAVTAAVTAARAAFPPKGLHWTVVEDPEYGSAQGPVDFETAQQYATEWEV